MKRWAQTSVGDTPPFPLSHETSKARTGSDAGVSREASQYPDRSGGEEQRTSSAKPVNIARPDKPEAFIPDYLEDAITKSVDTEGSGLFLKLKSLDERIESLKKGSAKDAALAKKRSKISERVAQALARRDTPELAFLGSADREAPPTATGLCSRCLRLAFRDTLTLHSTFTRKSRSMDDMLCALPECEDRSASAAEEDLNDILVWGEFGDDVSGLERNVPPCDTQSETKAVKLKKKRCTKQKHGSLAVYSEQLAAEIIAHQHSKARIESCRHTIALLTDRNSRLQDDIAKAGAAARDREEANARKLRAQQNNFEKLSATYAESLQESANQRADLLFKKNEARRKQDEMAAQLRKIQDIVGRGSFETVMTLCDAILSVTLPVRPDELDQSGEAQQVSTLQTAPELDCNIREVIRERDEARSELQELELQTAYMTNDWKNAIEHLQRVHLIETTRLRNELANALSQTFTKNTVTFASPPPPRRGQGGSDPVTPRELMESQSRQKSVAYVQTKSIPLSPDRPGSPPALLSPQRLSGRLKLPVSPQKSTVAQAGSQRVPTTRRENDGSPRLRATSARSSVRSSKRSSLSSNSTTGSVWLDETAEPGTVYGMSMEAQLHRALDREEELEQDLLCLEMEIEDLRRRFRNDEEIKELLAELIDCKLLLASANEENIALRNDIKKMTARRRQGGEIAGEDYVSNNEVDASWLSLFLRRKTSKLKSFKAQQISYARLPGLSPRGEREAGRGLASNAANELSGAGKAAMVLGTASMYKRSAEGGSGSDGVSESSDTSMVEAQLGAL